jgi:hypothetical protein
VEHPDRGGQQRKEAGIVSLALYLASLCVSLQGMESGEISSCLRATVVLGYAGWMVCCFDWIVLVCADL